MGDGKQLKPHHFKPGVSGNPNGRPKNVVTKEQWRKDLNKAIKAVEKKKKKKLLEQAVELAWKNPSLMAALLKKLIPDMKYVEAAVSVNHEDWVSLLEAEEEEGEDETPEQ